MIKTRFAPSPTGYLHLGSLRTAIFNWLYARAKGGKFFLRIEDTDTERSFQDATDNIFETLKWMGLDYDDDFVIQSKNKARHVEVAKELVAKGRAYYCYCSEERLSKMREEAASNKKQFFYDRYCLDHKDEVKKEGITPVIRLKAERSGSTTVNDLVQGRVTVENSQMDDMILVRSDGNPTYMLSVVVDDHDMGITDVIRGDDHLTNTFRQIQIYRAMDWDIPNFAHIPLIYNSEGKKLSKREGTVNLREYQDVYLSDALFNYLLRLGWAHGNDEIISREDAINWFDIRDVGRSPARYDVKKLQNINAHYLRNLNKDDAAALIKKYSKSEFDENRLEFFKSGFENVAKRCKTIRDLCNSARVYLDEKIIMKEDALDYLSRADLMFIPFLVDELNKISDWTEENIGEVFKAYAENSDMRLADVAQPIRCLLAGSTISPSVFEIMAIIGKEESMKKILCYSNFISK